jgi:hypothetical protein
MPYTLAATAGELLAGMADGRMFHSADRGHSWYDIGVELGSIVAMAAPDEGLSR